MQYHTLNKALKHFSSIADDITSRSMFGGFGIFAESTMFALVVDEQLYLRAGDENEKDFKDLGLTAYSYYKKSNMPVSTRYYQVPHHWWDQEHALLAEAKRSFEIAKQEKKSSGKQARIKDLPNLRVSTERMLRKVGINSPCELRQVGAAKAFEWLQRHNQADLSFELLWALEGAITGLHAKVVPLKRRKELLDSLHTQIDV